MSKEEYIANGTHQYCGTETPNGACTNLVSVASGDNGCIWHKTNYNK